METIREQSKADRGINLANFNAMIRAIKARIRFDPSDFVSRDNGAAGVMVSLRKGLSGRWSGVANVAGYWFVFANDTQSADQRQPFLGYNSITDNSSGNPLYLKAVVSGPGQLPTVTLENSASTIDPAVNTFERYLPTCSGDIHILS